MNLSYGNFIKERRKKLNLTQKDLANVLKVSIQQISKYEKDISKIDVSLISTFCKILKIDLKDFLIKNINSPLKEDFEDSFLNFDVSKFKKGMSYYRLKNNYTFIDLEERVNINKNRLSSFERNGSLPTIEEFKIIADLYNLDYLTFYYGYDETEENLYIKDKENKINNKKRIEEFKISKNDFKDIFKNKKVLSVILLLFIFVLTSSISLPLILSSSNNSQINDDISNNEEEDNKNPSNPSGDKEENGNNNDNNKPSIDDKPNEGEDDKPLEDNNEEDKLDLESLDELAKNFYFVISSKKEITITGFKKDDETIIIPGKAGSYIVKKIEYSSNSSFLSCKKIIIEEGLVEIGKNAFGVCSNLEYLSLPSTLARIDEEAFHTNPNLKEVVFPNGNENFTFINNSICSKDGKDLILCLEKREEISIYYVPEGIETIKTHAFVGNNNLKEIYLPESVKNIETLAIMDCYNLEKLHLNNTISELKERVICGSNNLKEFYIPKNIKKINNSPIISCYQFGGYKVDKDNEYFKDIDGSLYSKDGTILYSFKNSSLNQIIHIKEGVKKILKLAINFILDDCEYIILPSTLEFLNEDAIFNNPMLKGIIILNGAKGLQSKSIGGCENSSVYLESEKLPANSSLAFFDRENANQKIYYADSWEYVNGFPEPLI